MLKIPKEIFPASNFFSLLYQTFVEKNNSPNYKNNKTLVKSTNYLVKISKNLFPASNFIIYYTKLFGEKNNLRYYINIKTFV